MSPERPTNISFTPTVSSTHKRGLLGFLRFDYGDLHLDGIALRRTSAGHLALSFPERTDRLGRRHPYIRPVNDHARQELERLILAALGIER